MSQSQIKNFYKGKNVLLTGGTGYFGKLLIEKLLRTTEVNKIYLIVRSKQDMLSEKRVAKMFEEPVFYNISKSLFAEKVCAIEGDLRQKSVGLCKEDINIIQNKINVVFHCGASLNMDSKLAEAVMTNVNGTAEILEIMKEAQSLQAFILVSTAYSNCLNRIIEEVFYDPPIDPKLLIKIAKEMKPELFNNISREILGKWPNSYSFTKAVSENLLIYKGQNLPVGLFRPTIVTSTVSEPIPGWTDNLYGPLGILLSSGCGILRVVRGMPGIRADTVPGDMVISGLLCYAWDVATQWNKDPKTYRAQVINFSGKSSPLYMTIREYTTKVAESGYVPFRKMIWKPMLLIVNNSWIFLFLKFVLHTVPGYIIDVFSIIARQKPRMKKIYSRLDKVMGVLHYFLIQEWVIKDENVKALWEKLSPQDRITYNFDVMAIKRETYFKNLMAGLKKYTLKEDMSKGKYHEARYKSDGAAGQNKNHTTCDSDKFRQQTSI
ncbi:fatty acyl-CoA reductase wat-like isoform X2 [Anthonomus grandis grandis]|uniref:fatty acyl-CoA reductase wat-like isoform X2 n=1 Tax=Anthonomus grandis grandis TaxID=2921223 RepID=UPI00216525F1|nr:fatty acyl-CoA reductase wat-like isoform X2 [Anthonomus grandis grandis]